MTVQRILVVDDDPLSRDFLTEAVHALGFQALAAPNGEEALERIGSEQPDMVLTDLRMPGMDGIELSHQANKVNADLKVLFITGFAAVAMNAREEMGATRVLSKPFHLRELVDNVDRILAVGP